MRIRNLIAYLSLAMIMLPPVAMTQAAARNPADGASAIDIEVAAALKRRASAPAGRADTKAASASGVSIYGFDFVELKGRFLHEGLFPIPGNPSPGPVQAQAQLLGPWQTAQFRLVSESDEFLQAVDLSPPDEGEENTFLGSIDVPNQPFKLAVSGVDAQNAPYDLTWPVVFRPQALEVRFTAPFTLAQPGLVSLEFVVTNHGPAGTFQIAAEDDMDIGATPADAQIDIAQDGHATSSVGLNVPAISVGVLDIAVKATATRANQTANANHGSTVVRIQRFNLVLGDGFEGDPPGNGGLP